MFLTLVCELDGNTHWMTIDGDPKDCQDQANAFIGDGIFVTRVVLIGEK